MIDSSKIPYHLQIEKLERIPPLTDFESIKIGDVLHVPPILNYKRCDHKVLSKWPMYVVTDKTDENGNVQRSSLFKTELSMRFAVRLNEIGGKGND